MRFTWMSKPGSPVTETTRVKVSPIFTRPLAGLAKGPLPSCTSSFAMAVSPLKVTISWVSMSTLRDTVRAWLRLPSQRQRTALIVSHTYNNCITRFLTYSFRGSVGGCLLKLFDNSNVQVIRTPKQLFLWTLQQRIYSTNLLNPRLVLQHQHVLQIALPLRVERVHELRPARIQLHGETVLGLPGILLHISAIRIRVEPFRIDDAVELPVELDVDGHHVLGALHV